jgi:hypothetical protein
LIEAGPSGDLDSDLRVALLAIWAGADRRLAADFLRQSGDMKLESVTAAELTSNAIAPLARWYTDLRSATAKALVTSEAEAIRAMANALPRRLTGKPKRSGRAAKRQKSV